MGQVLTWGWRQRHDQTQCCPHGAVIYLSRIACLTYQPTTGFQDCVVFDELQALFQNHMLMWIGTLPRKVCSDRTPFSSPTSVYCLHFRQPLYPSSPSSTQCFFITCRDFSPAELCSAIRLPPKRAHYKPLFLCLLTMKACVT